MQTNTYPLDQSSALLLSGLLSAGHEESADSFPPLEDGPRFPLPRHCLAGNVPRAPRHYYGPDNDMGEVTSDLDNGDEDAAPRDRDVMPSRGNRSQVMRELRSMGYAWND